MVNVGIVKQSSMTTNGRMFQRVCKVAESPVSKVALPLTTTMRTTAREIKSTRTPSCLTTKVNYQDATELTAPPSTTMLVKSNALKIMDSITMSIKLDTMKPEKILIGKKMMCAWIISFGTVPHSRMMLSAHARQLILI